MLQHYRVRSAFAAKQVGREPLRIETFEAGDLLVALSSDGSYTTFSRHDVSIELDQRDRFVTEDEEFEKCVVAL